MLCFANMLRIPDIPVDLRGRKLTTCDGPKNCNRRSTYQASKKVKKAYEATRFNFILIELELEITFAETAAASASDEKTNRNIEHAMRACQGARKFLANSDFTPQ
jgi:hypothetical protein